MRRVFTTSGVAAAAIAVSIAMTGGMGTAVVGTGTAVVGTGTAVVGTGTAVVGTGTAALAEDRAGHATGIRPGSHHLKLSYGPRGKPANARAVLRCMPPRGSHPKKAEACRDLLSVGGDLDALGDAGGTCLAIFQPTTAIATGRWDGRPVRWSRTFSNACRLKQNTRSVFAF